MLDLLINVHSLYLLIRIRLYKHKCCQTSKYSKFPLLRSSLLISGYNSPLFCSHFSIIFTGAFTILLHKRSGLSFKTKFLNGGTLLGLHCMDLTCTEMILQEFHCNTANLCHHLNNKMTVTTHWLIPVKSSVLISAIRLNCIVLI